MITEYLSREDPLHAETPSTPSDTREALRRLVFTYVTDGLYFLLSVFTVFYFCAVTVTFFSARHDFYFVTIQLLKALSEPYLAALSLYVILKEIRKRKIEKESRHFGEIFLVLWLILFAVSSSVVFYTDTYVFDDVMSLITTASLTSLVLYIAGLIHKP